MSQLLGDSDELLFRQVHPKFIVDGQPSSQSFQPTPKDNSRLSVDRSALTSAAAAFALYTNNGHASAAVYGLTVGEFADQQLSCHSDPLDATEGQAANRAHAYADYSPHPTNQQKIKAKRLKLKALARGCLYP